MVRHPWTRDGRHRQAIDANLDLTKEVKPSAFDECIDVRRDHGLDRLRQHQIGDGMVTGVWPARDRIPIDQGRQIDGRQLVALEEEFGLIFDASRQRRPCSAVLSCILSARTFGQLPCIRQIAGWRHRKSGSRQQSQSIIQDRIQRDRDAVLKRNRSQDFVAWVERHLRAIRIHAHAKVNTGAWSPGGCAWASRMLAP